ncbi:DUF4411 family protein [Sphingomonas endolithica]|uniref:DUF4411 family protein n=1 Tax=Sphingomonas endolithica TaxID=2972485 RepID=UPI0021B039FA|nr:DUF4411 family protein [Sphingomonas sp. ZFBP2030]
MLYLLDANALINAHNGWYALNRVPEFWRWLLHHAEAGTVMMPAETYGEVETGNDDLAGWMKQADTKRLLRLTEEADPAKVQAVLTKYGDNLTEDELITIGQDPFLIAAVFGHADRIVVTGEVSRSSKTRAKRKVPDICNDLGVPWRSPVELIRELDFTTGWDQP